MNALTTRSLLTREERVVSCLSAEQSLNVRDAFVKGVYHRLFFHIINKINEALNLYVFEVFTTKSNIMRVCASSLSCLLLLFDGSPKI